jgi:hypothetical protein
MATGNLPPWGEGGQERAWGRRVWLFKRVLVCSLLQIQLLQGKVRPAAGCYVPTMKAQGLQCVLP